MKKGLGAITMLVMLLAIIVPLNAYASAPWAFWFDCQCEPAPMIGFSEQLQVMDSNQTFAEIRHVVVGEGVDANLTNLMGVYKGEAGTQLVFGTKWMPPDGLYYRINVALHQGKYYAPCGRANTKYSELFGSTMVRIEGQWRVN